MNLVEKLRASSKLFRPVEHHAADRIEALEQLAKDMAEALEQVLYTGNPYTGKIDKALSRYREVCGGEK